MMASLSQRFLWVVFLCCFLIDEVDLSGHGEVRLEVLLTRFSNPQNRNALNQCCDGKKNASTCTDSCDIFFVVCVPTEVSTASCEKSGVILRNSSEFISSQRNFTFSSGSTLGNFLSMSFTTDPQTFTQFSIRFYDDDSSTGLPNLGNQSSLEAVINYTETLPTPVKYISIHRNSSKNNISFEFIYRLRWKCKKDYYREMCDKYCKPRNDTFGHTECLSNGKKICLPGWKVRPICTTPICPGGCGVHGKCKKPNFCSCNNGWTGPSCAECVPDPSCLHATCTDPHVGGCHCKANWTGQYCNVYMDYCSHFHPCKNGQCHNNHLKNFTCTCSSGWSGRKCERFLCSPSCNLTNAVCTSHGECRCNNGWTGPSCAECVPDRSCLHATCTDPHVGGCHCKANWTGQYCNVYMDYCSHFHPCKNGQCYNNHLKNFTCTCSSGWSGHKCERFLCSPSCNLTNAVCTSHGECSCKAGWTGPNCNQCIPTTNCTHGNCSRPFECLCEEGWSGENCTEPVSKSSCSEQNHCQNDGVCIDVPMSNYRCDCKRGFTGRHCQDKVLNPCSKWCNESYGYCQDNECKCHTGWQGPNCTECIKNSSCVNGYCRQPFECMCHENWTGSFCNISLNVTNECTSGSNRPQCGEKERMGSDESISDIDKLIYILSSVLVLLIIACLLCLVRILRRRRATFHVSSSEEVVTNNFRPSYITGNNPGENGFTLNNNVSAKPDFANFTSSEILLNPMTLQPSQNSRSMLIDNEPVIYESNGVISNEDNSPDSSEYCII